MKGLVAFDADGGGSIIVEVDEWDPGFERAAVRGGALVEETGKRFDAALEAVRPIATAFVSKITQVAEPPEEITLEFGLNLNLKAGAVLASSQAEAHLQVTLTWKKPSSTEDSPA